MLHTPNWRRTDSCSAEYIGRVIRSSCRRSSSKKPLMCTTTTNLFFFHFPSVFSADLICAGLTDDLNPNHIRASAVSLVSDQSFSLKPDIFGALTVSSRTCRSSCPPSEMQARSRNFVSDPVLQREPRSHGTAALSSLCLGQKG